MTLQMLHILQSHYPERLGLALIINVPFLVNAFFKVIMPFVDPVTRAKVKFNPSIFDDGFFTTDQVMNVQGWNGAKEFEWDHAKYWPALVNMCEERQKKQMQRWRELGAKVGLSEWDMKTGWNEGVSTQQIDTAVTEKRVEVEAVEIQPSAEATA